VETDTPTGTPKMPCSERNWVSMNRSSPVEHEHAGEDRKAEPQRAPRRLEQQHDQEQAEHVVERPGGIQALNALAGQIA
jgi:hypothetical protein